MFYPRGNPPNWDDEDESQSEKEEGEEGQPEEEGEEESKQSSFDSNESFMFLTDPIVWFIVIMIGIVLWAIFGAIFGHN